GDLARGRRVDLVVVRPEDRPVGRDRLQPGLHLRVVVPGSESRRVAAGLEGVAGPLLLRHVHRQVELCGHPRPVVDPHARHPAGEPRLAAGDRLIRRVGAVPVVTKDRLDGRTATATATATIGPGVAAALLVAALVYDIDAVGQERNFQSPGAAARVPPAAVPVFGSDADAGPPQKTGRLVPDVLSRTGHWVPSWTRTIGVRSTAAAMAATRVSSTAVITASSAARTSSCTVGEKAIGCS